MSRFHPGSKRPKADQHPPSAPDYVARTVALISLGLSAATFALGWYNTQKQDTDDLALTCNEQLTGYPFMDLGVWTHAGRSYPTLDAIATRFGPLMLVECDLTNAGRRPLSVVRFSASAAPPPSGPGNSAAPEYHEIIDSTLIALPLTIGQGDTKRVSLLIAKSLSDSSAFDALHLVAPSGRPFLIGLEGVDSLQTESSWLFHFAFATAMGQTRHYVTALVRLRPVRVPPA